MWQMGSSVADLGGILGVPWNPPLGWPSTDDRLNGTPLPPCLAKELRKLLLCLTLACFSRTLDRNGWIDRQGKKFLSKTIENGRGLIKSGRGFKCFARASRAILKQNPPSRNPASATVPAYTSYHVNHPWPVCMATMIIAVAIERLHVTSLIETNTQLSSAWQNRLDQASQYKCVPYSSHSSRSSVRMDASSLGSFYHCASL